MTQNASFIDVTRSYIPVNPNSFPDGLHIAKEGPEDRVPVLAYKGQNFLPTPQGYRSYFGTNQALNAGALAERVDFILTFQNNSLENILIALCDSGIWYKKGNIPGAWTQVYTLSNYRGTTTHFDWTWTIINNDLYVYRQNNGSYQKISSAATAQGFTLTDVTPNFLNMAAQQGIYRSGARLGFWDSSDATAWSNLDDFADFTPSIETLSNIITFSDVVGRIVTIKSHGDGFVIYATRSVVYIRENLDSEFQYIPTSILTDVGISYPREVEVATPDSTHYVYTSAGLYQIENGQGKVIVPEVTDFLKEGRGPFYLQFINSRFLFIETLDGTYLNGIPQYGDQVIDATTIVFPGSNLNLLNAVADAQTQGSIGYCGIFGALSNGGALQPEDEDPSIVWRPIYTAFLSGAGAGDPDIEWGVDPCFVTNLGDMTPFGMTPVGTPTYELATTGTAGKTEVAGVDAYVDGRWTIERFIAAQSAIWQIQEDALAEFLGNILARSHVSTRTYENPSEVTSLVTTRCDIGRYVTAYSAPRFGFSQCEFWLTRFVIAAADFKVVKTNRLTSVLVPAVTIPRPLAGFRMGTSFSYLAPECTGLYPTAQAAFIACCTRAGGAGCNLGWVAVPNPGSVNAAGVAMQYDLPSGYTVNGEYASLEPGWTAGPGTGQMTYPAHYLVTEQNTAYIEAIDVPIAPTPETGYCKLTGWQDYSSGTIIAASSCTAPELTDPNNQLPVPINPQNGQVCAEPFAPFTIPGTPPVVVNWPARTVTIPSGTFFLQVGSAAPLYPTMEGAYVYDTHLKKWGIYKGRYVRLLDYSPINSYTASSQVYSRFGIMGGILAEGGLLRLFDTFPADSSITYGKIGYYRRGNTEPQELHVHMKNPSDFTLTLETSLGGKNLSIGLDVSQSFVNASKAVLYGGYPGVWHNAKISGYFDITYMEFRGVPAARR